MQTAVLARQTDRVTAEVVDQRDDVLLHFAAEHPFDDFHRLFVGDAHALDERALLADLLQRLVDLRTAAVHDDRVNADQLQQDHVAREALLQPLLRHGVAAVVDDHRSYRDTGGCRAAPRPGFQLSGWARSAKGREARTWRQGSGDGTV